MEKSTRQHISRRKFLQTGIVGAAGLSMTGFGNISEDYEMVEQVITIKNLPQAFDGFTIGLMSDIHSSSIMTKEDMQKYVHEMNVLKTDMIAVTGDFVNSKTEEVYPFIEAFSELRAPYGVFGCLGNHDFFTDNVELVAKEIDGCGITLLRNDNILIQKDGSSFALLGVDDIGRGTDPNDYITRSLPTSAADVPRILLCHKPYYMDTYISHKIDLTLSGHTHGGQIVFAKIGKTLITPATLFSQYVEGLYEKGSSQLYVNRGIGSVGIPMRINCPPELTRITLRSSLPSPHISGSK